ncbi:MAG: hypothetical protein R3301_05780 [Saprospiraceae bacterium]|nr:hypothetical protein [Saprospiraceae bacterium]
MRYLLTILVICGMCGTSVLGQNSKNLYQYYFDLAEIFYELGDYVQANKLYKAAEISTRDLSLQREALIKVILSDSAYVAQLRAEELKARVARDSARAAAENARRARQIAEQQKRYSDALYLAFITDKEVERRVLQSTAEHQDSLLMQLAMYGTQLTGNQYVRSIQSVFGRAAYNANRLLLDEHEAGIAQIINDETGGFYTHGRDGVITYHERAQDKARQAVADDMVQHFEVFDHGLTLTVYRDDPAIVIRNDSLSGSFTRYTFDHRINDVVYHPVKGLLCVALQGAPMQFIKTGTSLPRVVDHGGDWVRGLVMSPDSRYIAARGARGTLSVWNLDGEPVIPAFQAHEQYVYDVVFSPDGRQFVTCSADQTARVWNLDGTVAHTLRHHQNPVFKVQFSSDGTKLLTYSIGKDAAIWDRNGTLLATLQKGAPFDANQIDDVFFHPDNASVLSISGDRVQRITYEGFSFVAQNFVHGSEILDIDVSRDGKYLLTYGDDQIVRLWDIDPASYQELELDGHLLMETSDISNLDLGYVTTATFSPDVCCMYIGMSSGIVQVVPLPHRVRLMLEQSPVVFYVDPDEKFVEENNLEEILSQFPVIWRDSGSEIDLIDIRN